MSSVLDNPVLVLNKSWEPIDVYSVQKAITHVFAERAKCMSTDAVSYSKVNVNLREVENFSFNEFSIFDFSEWSDLPLVEGQPFLRTGRTEIRVPEIIVLESYATAKRRKLACTKRNLARRDNHTCQYCGKHVSPSDETTDHIIPQALKGVHSWTNCVIACLSCNSRKGHKRLVETNMRMIDRPELVAKYPHDPSKWNVPYEPAWSAIFRVLPSKRRESWSKFVK